MSEGTGPVESTPPRRPPGPIAVALVVVLGAVGGFVGAVCTHPKYRSVGLIDIAPKLPKILHQIDETGLMPMFDQYVDSQAQLATSRRVMDIAMNSEEWKKLKRGLSDDEIARFAEGLSVTRRNQGEVLEIAFVDEHPDAAMTAVNSVIDAYMRIVEERESNTGNKTQTALIARQKLIKSKLNELRGRVMTVTDKLGAEQVEARYKAAIDECNKLDAAIHDLDQDVATDVSEADREKRRARLMALRDGARAEVPKLAQQRFELSDLESERRMESERLDEVERRIDEINVESGVHGRTSVIARGDRPVTTYSEPRVTFAMLGAVGGLSLGSGIVSLSRSRKTAPPA